MSIAYGAGPPRSGTTMLARCMSVIVPAHHECASDYKEMSRQNTDAWSGVVGDLVLPSHDIEAFESAFWYTFIAGRLERPVIHLWRPAVSWIRSMYGKGFDLVTHKSYFALNPPEGSRIERLCWLYNEYHRALLSISALRVEPGKVPWEDVFDYCEISQPDARRLEIVRTIESMRPNQGHNVQPLSKAASDKVERLCGQIESELRA